MLDVRLKIQQAANDCAVTLITDLTGLYSSSNPGGWGTANPLPADVVITLTRTGPDGLSSSITLNFTAAGEIHKICNTWRYDTATPVNPDPCGCTQSFYEPTVPAVVDGCYTYVTSVSSKSTGAFIEKSSQIIPQFCYTRARKREIGFALSTNCGLGVDDRYKLNTWALAWDKFQSVVEMPEVDCIISGARIEQINTLLNGIA